MCVCIHTFVSPLKRKAKYYLIGILTKKYWFSVLPGSHGIPASKLYDFIEVLYMLSNHPNSGKKIF